MITIGPWEGAAGEWDRLVAADPEGSFTHLSAWRAVMREGLGHELLPLAALDETGRLEGVLPLVRVRSALFGHYLVSMPFLNAGGPLGSAPARAALTEAACAEAQASGADLLELRTRERAPEGLDVSRRKITHLLPLPGESDLLWKELPAKVRSQIRRPQKDGFTVRTGLDQCDPFYEVFARHMRALGTPVLAHAWFRAIATHFPCEAVFAVVYDRDTPVAGGCGFVWRGSCEITWASARREWNRSAPNMLLYWSFLQEAIARGATVFDFGRCTPGSATHAFKRQWGGEDLPLNWGQWRRGRVAATPSPEGRFFHLATRCWQRLPLAVTNLFGPRLARCLP
jgi:FemAB-related protein (PEP-CTERM system-associated)